MSCKIGIIGVGGLSENRILPALAELDAFNVEAVLDNNSDRLAHIGDKFSIPKVLSSEEKFFSLPLDAVYIATPNALHVPFAIKALECKMGVMIEKPCSDTLQAARQLPAIAKQADRPVMLAYMSKMNRYNQTAIKLVQEGAIGELLSMTASFGFLYTDKSAWRFQKKVSGFGVLGDVGIYPVTTALDIFGEAPLFCTATGYPVDSEEWTDRVVSSRVLFPRGKSLQISTSFMQKQPGNNYVLIGTAGAIEVSNSWEQTGEGTLLLDNGDDVQEINAEAVNPYVEEFKVFKACLDGEAVPREMSLERGVQDMAVLDAICRSAAAKGKEIAVDL